MEKKWLEFRDRALSWMGKGPWPKSELTYQQNVKIEEKIYKNKYMGRENEERRGSVVES